jgi:hypothetical protein
MSASDVVSCEGTQTRVLDFWGPIEIFVGLQGGSVGNKSRASNMYVVSVHLLFYLDSLSRVARYVLLVDILVAVWVVWVLCGRVWTNVKVAFLACPDHSVSFFRRFSMLSNPVPWSMLERWIILAQTEVVTLQVRDLLIQARFVYLTLVRHGTIFILECGFFEACRRYKIRLDVIEDFGLSLVFSDIIRSLRVMLKQLSCVVHSVTLTHMKVWLWESQLLSCNLIHVRGFHMAKRFMYRERVCLVKKLLRLGIHIIVHHRAPGYTRL